MRKYWTVTVDDREHLVDVSWDVLATGAGRIAVDGVEVMRWGIGVRFPGFSKRFLVESRAAQVKQGLFNFDLTVEGAQISPPRVVTESTAGALIVVISVFVIIAVVMLIALMIYGGIHGSN